MQQHASMSKLADVHHPVRYSNHDIDDGCAALRHVADALLKGVYAKQSSSQGLQLGSDGQEGSHPGKPVYMSLAYLRDRVGVPRDLPFPAARQLRAHLNWFMSALE